MRAVVSPTDYLEIVTQRGRYVLVEKSAPDDPLKVGVITIKDADGSGESQTQMEIFDELFTKDFSIRDSVRRTSTEVSGA